MRISIKRQGEEDLTFFTLNKYGQTLLKEELPAVFKHMGMDVVNNCEFIF